MRGTPRDVCTSHRSFTKIESRTTKCCTWRPLDEREALAVGSLLDCLFLGSARMYQPEENDNSSMIPQTRRMILSRDKDINTTTSTRHTQPGYTCKKKKTRSVRDSAVSRKTASKIGHLLDSETALFSSKFWQLFLQPPNHQNIACTHDANKVLVAKV